MKHRMKELELLELLELSRIPFRNSGNKIEKSCVIQILLGDKQSVFHKLFINQYCSQSVQNSVSVETVIVEGVSMQEV